ncbi:hypothetical protein QT970_12665 [Microcoleus sp. herbarium8]|uniref:hypothetical protein n=1 Tax=Microcoleus sp. herbarium8 TaxID=3055436 RepID=UPI002FD29931
MIHNMHCNFTVKTSLPQLDSKVNEAWRPTTEYELRKNQSSPIYQQVSSKTRDIRVEQKKALRPEGVESSTLRQNYSKELSEEIYRLFKASEEQIFEDGMETEFSKKLILLIKEYADEAIEIITGIILYERVNAEVATEALRWLGNIDHAPSYRFRLWLLERSLSCSKARIRDGAILGLSSLNNPHAISYLKLAIEQEKCTELRKDMEQVLAQLESIS